MQVLLVALAVAGCGASGPVPQLGRGEIRLLIRREATVRAVRVGVDGVGVPVEGSEQRFAIPAGAHTVWIEAEADMSRGLTCADGVVPASRPVTLIANQSLCLCARLRPGVELPVDIELTEHCSSTNEDGRREQSPSRP